MGIVGEEERMSTHAPHIQLQTGLYTTKGGEESGY